MYTEHKQQMIFFSLPLFAVLVPSARHGQWTAATNAQI